MNELLAMDPGYFLVDVKIMPGNNVKVFIDADNGAIIDKLVQYNRKLYKELEESNIFPNNDFSLEVSSAGIDEPLKMRRQYFKNIGRNVEVTTKDGIKKEGKLVAVSEENIELEEKKSGHSKPTGGKKEIIHHNIAFDNIKTTKVQVTF